MSMEAARLYAITMALAATMRAASICTPGRKRRIQKYTTITRKRAADEDGSRAAASLTPNNLKLAAAFQ